MTRNWIPSTLAAAMLTLAAASGPAMAAEPAAVVEATDQLTFVPQEVTITAGETVEWKNVSRVRHTVTADPDEASDLDHVQLPDGAEPFDSGWMDEGDTYQHTFTVPGTYRYFCIPHEAAGMIGTVTVEPGD